MRISIVTPTLNRAHYLRGCVESVLEQDYSDVEHVVVDGGSTDGTAALLRSLGARYGSRLRWVSRKDSGISDATNRGFEMASGDVLCTMGSDDRLLPGALARVASHFEQHPAVQWLYGGYQEIDTEGRFRRLRPARPYDRKRFIRTGYICGPSVFINSRIARQAGPWREDLKYCMDFEWLLRVAALADGRPLEAVLAQWRWHPGGITMRLRLAQLDEGLRVSLSYATGLLERAHIVLFYRLAKSWAWFKLFRWRLKHGGVAGLWQPIASKLPSSEAAE
jgi:glycosyltransferase involved in cell wall biosynthesis